MSSDRYNAELPLQAKHLLLPRIGKRMTAFVRYCLEPKETWLANIEEECKKRGLPKERFFLELAGDEDLVFSLAFGFATIGFEDGLTLALGYRQDLDSVLLWQDGFNVPALKDEPGTFPIEAADLRYSRKKFGDLVGCVLKKVTIFRPRKLTETAGTPNQIGLGFTFEGSGKFVFGCGFQADQCSTTILGYDDISPSARPLLKEVTIAPEKRFWNWSLGKC